MLVLSHNGRMEATGDDDPHAVSNGNGINNHHANEQERYDQFVAALDNIPVEGLGQSIAMDQLASTLGWTLRETEEYAYRYFATLSELSEEEHVMERMREARQTDYLQRSNSQHSPGSWSPAENRLLQTLLASLSAPQGDESVNLVARLMRFFPARSREDIERQVNYLRQRRRVTESMQN